MNHSSTNNRGWRIAYTSSASEKDLSLLFSGINDEAAKQREMKPIQTFGLFIRDSEEAIIGGANGIFYYGCLYIDMLWVKQEFRHQGWGSKLMREAEKKGLQNLCSFATVNTMDWEALPFYQKLGYQIEFERTGYSQGARMYLLRKPLLDSKNLCE
ncbi:MAG: GNAT family N-acetyltransferase [Parachlamydiaceae bacterium]